MGRNAANEQTFQAWEKNIEEGVPYFEASRLAGTTMRRLRDADRVRAEDAIALSRERQAAKVEVVMGEEMSKQERSPQLVALQAKAQHPDYADRTKLEISGTVEHEISWRFNIDDLALIAAERGIIDARPRPALPVAAEVLPDQAE